jgi:hypothetical protein
VTLCSRWRARRTRSLITVRFGSFSITARGDKVVYTLPADMQVEVQVSYVDASGNPATVDGDVTWSSSDDTIVQVQVNSADSTLCEVIAPGPVGNAQVTATADADLGAGSTPIVCLMDVTVASGQAVSGTIQPVGPPEPIPGV